MLRNEDEVQITHQKLERLEALYKDRQLERGGDEVLREMTMESLAETIKQFKEEIARYECGSAPANERMNGANGSRWLKNEQALTNTRVKLRSLEEMYAEEQAASSEDPELRKLSRRSLKRTINQLKEEIARFEAHHQPARR